MPYRVFVVLIGLAMSATCRLKGEKTRKNGAKTQNSSCRRLN